MAIMVGVCLFEVVAVVIYSPKSNVSLYWIGRRECTRARIYFFSCVYSFIFTLGSVRYGRVVLQAGREADGRCARMRVERDWSASCTLCNDILLFLQFTVYIRVGLFVRCVVNPLE
jgi:hypothetical protein